MKAFFDYLESRCKESNSLLCVGLDPHPELLLKPSPISAREYCIKSMPVLSNQTVLSLRLLVQKV